MVELNSNSQIMSGLEHGAATAQNGCMSQLATAASSEERYFHLLLLVRKVALQWSAAKCKVALQSALVVSQHARFRIGVYVSLNFQLNILKYYIM